VGGREIFSRGVCFGVGLLSAKEVLSGELGPRNSWGSLSSGH